MGLEEKVETDYHVVGAGGAGLVKEQLFLKVALGGAELVGLNAVHIHAGHHEIYAGESVGDTLAQYAQHLGGDGDYVHYGVGPAVVIPGLDDLNICPRSSQRLNIYLFDDILVFLHELIQKLTAYGHLAVSGNVVVVAPFHGIYVEGLYDQATQVDILCHLRSSVNYFLYKKIL